MEEKSTPSSLLKRSKCASEPSNVDRLSDLPESLRYHLLSFLDTKYVVQTSILSKTWRYSWKCMMPNLKFNRDNYNLSSKFANFVDEILLRQDDCTIQKFHLVCGQFWDPAKICKWIEVAVGRNVEELYVEMTWEAFDVIELPPSLFTCESLKVMELDFFSRWPSIVLMLPDSINLPRLETLRLGSILFHDDMNGLFSMCPVLETLSINSCSFATEMDLNIFAPQLKNLVIENFIRQCHLSDFKVKIRAPSLTSFKCRDFMVNNYVLEDVKSLVNADIDMAIDSGRDPGGFDLYVEKKGKHGRRVINTFSELSSVKVLTLSSWSLQFLSDVLDELKHQATLFRKLRSLRVKTFGSSACYLSLTYLLKSLPNIESLSMHVDKTTLSSKHHDESLEREFSLHCMLHHLKFVEIRDFKGCKLEIELLKFLLKNAIALEKLVIISNEKSSIAREKLLEECNDKLKSFPCASSSVSMCFSYDGNRIRRCG